MEGSKSTWSCVRKKIPSTKTVRVSMSVPTWRRIAIAL